MGLITEYLRTDHGRLDGLCSLEAFDEFRQGLLKHIGLEETVLLPALLGKPGAPLKLAEKLRLDHGALTNLLVPQPAPEILRAVKTILAPHNRLEEEPGGFYDACDRLLAPEAEALVRRMKAAPELPLRPYSKRPEALEAAKRAMRRAGFEWEECVRA